MKQNQLIWDEIKLFMSLPNRAGIITRMDSIHDGEDIRMLVMLVMLND